MKSEKIHTAKIALLQGLPGSGKATYAKTMRGYKRVNMDDLRSMIDDGIYSKQNEKTIRKIRDSIIKKLLSIGEKVVIDDTNFHSSHINQINAISIRHKSTMEVIKIETSLAECLRSNSLRDGSDRVPDQVIIDMSKKYCGNPCHLGIATL